MPSINRTLVNTIRGSEPVLDRVKIIAPSTTANIGPGFDVFGLALDVFHDVLEVEVTSSYKIDVELFGNDVQLISREPDKNTAGLVAKLVLEETQRDFGLKISINKGIPVGKGLGSSGASAAASAFALNAILQLGLSTNQLVDLASQGEIASAGAPHADNVSAALLGGFIVIQSYTPLDVIRLEPPSNLEIALAIPETPVPPKKTEIARSILPKTVPLEKVVHNICHATSIVAGIALKDVGIMGRGMVDLIVEPCRSSFIPAYLEIKKSALEAGASGVAISGSGPSMIAFVDSNKSSTPSVAKAMKKACETVGIQCSAYVSKPDTGTSLLEG